jgi:uncharacterized protein (TIGR02271 family)
MNNDITQDYNWQGRTLKDRNGDKIGTIDALYLDQVTDKPEWALVNTGLFGTKSSFVPLAGAADRGDEIVTEVEAQQVKDAPKMDPDQELSERQEAELFRHYGIDYTTEGSVTATDKPNGAVGHDTSGPTTDDAMTRSEEELRVGTAERESGRARLRKYVVTEQVEQTVPVSREEVRVEREPITDANRGDALSGGDLTEEEHEVTLTAQRAVASKETVPVERVRLGTETVTEQQQVDETVRKEVIDEVETDGTTGRRTGRAKNKK